MLLQILLRAFRSERDNLLILSRNKNFGQDIKFNRVREILEENDILVAVAHPDSDKFDGIDRTPISQTYIGTSDYQKKKTLEPLFAVPTATNVNFNAFMYDWSILLLKYVQDYFVHHQ